MTRVVIVQPYVPRYRVPFFEGLATTLAQAGIDLTVAAGRAADGQAARGDSAEIPGLVRLPERRLGMGPRSLVVRSLRDVLHDADLIVMEQARRNLEAYPLLYTRAPAPVVLWGHGQTSNRTASHWEHRWLDNMTKRADWFFAYTEKGRRYMVDKGFPHERAVVVQNATDTTQLMRQRSDVSVAQRRDMLNGLRLTDGRTALYVGALDRSKRIGFLLAAAESLAARVEGFTLVVAGDGPLRPLVEGSARSEPWLRYVGPAFGADKALVASVADVILNPGAVGLSIVDSFALGVPMITTARAGHGPEFDYIENGVNGLVASDRLSEFVAAAELVLSDHLLLDHLRRGCERAASIYRIESMVCRFAQGIDRALNTDRSVRLS
jgi:glycosyltransferase involved in cell wall biosynthesis